MSSLKRMLSVLDLFSREHTAMTADQIAEALDLTRTTCYRYTRELSNAGLLVSDGGLFMLGSRIIELDHRIIESDPLLNAGRPVVTALADSLGATGLLTTSYDDRIVNIFEHAGGLAELPLSFGRGTTMPTFRSSSSKVILASMSRSRLKRIWRLHEGDADCQAIGQDWLAFWKGLQLVKRQGYWTSIGEIDRGLAGVAAPILFGTGDVAGSMSLVFTLEDFRMYEADLLGARLRGAAAKVSSALAGLHATRPPQADSPEPPPAKASSRASQGEPPARAPGKTTKTQARKARSA